MCTYISKTVAQYFIQWTTLMLRSLCQTDLKRTKKKEHIGAEIISFSVTRMNFGLAFGFYSI